MTWTIRDIPPQVRKLAVVTGANSGIGWHTARVLARAGCEVILAARSPEKGRDAAETIRREFPQAKVRAEILDLASFVSIRRFAAKIDKEPKLDLLINNAGVMAIPQRELTADGFERQLGVNFLGHYALTALLVPTLLRARAPRVTTVSSIAANMRMKLINFDDLQAEHSYDPWNAYSQSKLADLMFALELSRRCERKNYSLLSNAAHPGYSRTNLFTSGPGKPPGPKQSFLLRYFSQEAASGALPLLRAATDYDAAPGSYYGPSGFFQLKGDPVPVAIPKPAQDEAAAKKLWETAASLTQVYFPL
ncbi:MAG TPA: oxidoreductase [Acidobacteriaceae bacterium]|nr:oxidoreductase [Acidobacteriaceae bacterium]